MDNKIKLLEMIQNVVARMTSNSFVLKGWAVTLVAGIFALSTKEADKMFILIAYVPIILFWFLDSYYLQLERKYRKLYDDTIKKPDNEIDFKLPVLPSNSENKTCFYQSLFSCTEVGFYLPAALLFSILIIVSLII
ncbi:hypothetical protein NXH76_01060 [Blautia schinkii]|nr:hypothetical protein [Blautia schinkii]